MVAVDFTQGFEAVLAATSPLTRYAAFVRDAAGREPTSSEVRTGDDLLRLLHSKSARLRRTYAVRLGGRGRLAGRGQRPMTSRL